MKNKSISIKKYILKYGILYGIIGIIFSLLLYLTENYTKQNLLFPSISFFITISTIILGLMVYKKNNNGYISLKEALKIGIGISLLGGLMVILWKILLTQVIDPEIITQIEDIQIKRLAEKFPNFTQKNMDQHIAITRKYTSPLALLTIALTEHLFLGFLISLIGGLIIRKKRNPFQ
ncbi:DUF4199 domain-containing protein [Aquimarina sp. 2201CG14-23]|uniref:DUF4199 domain-containing protein n=1 Tax=Aquimarina mycalae TaxID=3040073 RepID=UPI00247804B7|nr:DUF4199 domain-containing protein [Aquimarina sp. 2201CG14-23]MDH7447214.1 DUF4199 domain-containing protein [Aquimarina sp. 2201CG14-23]